MKIHEQCKCGFFFFFSKISNRIRYDKNDEIYQLKIGESWQIADYCVGCGGRYLYEFIPYEELNILKGCYCDVKTDFSDTKQSGLGMFEGTPFILISKEFISLEDSNPEIAEIRFGAIFCFRCGGVIPSIQSTRKIEIAYETPNKKELNEIYKKLSLIERYEDILPVLGEPSQITKAEMFQPKYLPFEFKFIKKQLNYPNIIESANLQISLFIEGELSFTITPKPK